ncbi:hypothetical protein COU39_03895 [Candidatus Micrarchaeota archaeon CG10_big_fil_rev_8_21_14_0_10_60_32]|nr:MAG: hypothetical protein COU39_03895 [Candidatus Micrarchaeota archaeon CG10_big_fil_rev_8_21_14_0_10_60_32]
MQMEITEKKRNELFKRFEVKAVKHSNAATPNRKEILAEIASDLKVPVERIAVDKVEQKFGDKQVAVYARAYDSADQLKKIEPAYKAARTEGKKKGEKKG